MNAERKSDIDAEALIAAIGIDETRELIGEFQRGWELEKMGAAKRQEVLAARNAQMDHFCMDGLGQHVATIDYAVYHYWGQRLGYECWKNAEWRNKFLKDNPDCRVKYTRRPSVIVRP